MFLFNNKYTTIHKLQSRMSEINNHTNFSELDIIQQYPNEQILISVCKSFEGQEIIVQSSFMEKKSTVCTCNAVGDMSEELFYPIFKEKLDDFEKGPKQASPDYYGIIKLLSLNKKYL